MQALPVKELRKLFIKKKAIVEQVQDETDETSESPKDFTEKSVENLFLKSLLSMSADFSKEQVKVALHNFGILEDHFHPDISTPPPNAACA